MDTNYWDGCYKQRYFDKRTQDEIEGECAGTDSVNRTHKKKLSRKLTTLFGTVIANWIGYGGRKINTLFPLDGEFNLPAQQYSHGLRQGYYPCDWVFVESCICLLFSDFNTCRSLGEQTFTAYPWREIKLSCPRYAPECDFTQTPSRRT